MQTNMNLLKGKIREHGLTQSDVATRIGMDSSTFSRKVSADGLKFTVGEMHSIAAVLSLTNDECRDIFCPKTRNNARIGLGRLKEVNRSDSVRNLIYVAYCRCRMHCYEKKVRTPNGTQLMLLECVFSPLS